MKRLPEHRGTCRLSWLGGWLREVLEQGTFTAKSHSFSVLETFRNSLASPSHNHGPFRPSLANQSLLPWTYSRQSFSRQATYWGCLATILTRLSYHLTPDLLCVLVFVDDFMAVLGQNAAEVTSGILMLTLLGCPISWHKNVLHPLNRWLGYMVDINEATNLVAGGQAHSPVACPQKVGGRRPSRTEGGDVSPKQTLMGG